MEVNEFSKGNIDCILNDDDGMVVWAKFICNTCKTEKLWDDHSLAKKELFMEMEAFMKEHEHEKV